MTATCAPVLIMAGGTGGHIYPGLAVAEVLRASGIEVRWLGSSGGMECEKVPAHGIELDSIHISGLRGKGLTGWLKLPFKLLRAVREATTVMAAQKPACAISFGGYVAGPGGIAAWLKGVPLLVHEQNCIPGMTNSTLARVAKTVMQAFPGTFPASREPETCGNPVRQAVTDIPEPQQRWQGRQGAPRLLVTGGSQGARVLNQVLPAAVALLGSDDMPVIKHQTGQSAVESVRAAYENYPGKVEVTAFIDDMGEAYSWADLIVCRSGALTVSELAAAGLGSVLVPFPYAVDDHQTANAGFLAEAGAALILPEADLTPERLAQELSTTLCKRDAALGMAQAARSVAIPESALKVAQACKRWVER